MKVTIAVDDISLPLPPMATPDIRQTMLEIVLRDARATRRRRRAHHHRHSLHRRMTDWEMKRMVGAKIFDAFYPDRYYNHDAEDPDGMVHLGKTDHDEPVEHQPARASRATWSSTSTSTSCRWTAATSRSAVGLCDYESLQAHHDAADDPRSRTRYMDPKRSMLNARRSSARASSSTST